MQAPSAGDALACSPERCRTLVASNGAVWIWPGIPLTMRHGVEVLPATDATIRFWISRLHGTEVLDRNLSRAVASAAQRLAVEDEIGAQRAIDALQLTELSQDGAWLCRAAATYLGVQAPNLPVCTTLRTWNERDVALHLSIFKYYADTARVLAKGIVPFDPEKHPRWGAGAPDSQGGQFAPAGESDAAIIPVTARRRRYPKRQPPPSDHYGDPSQPIRGIGDNSEKYQELPELPEEAPPPDKRLEVVNALDDLLQEALMGGAPLFIHNLLQGLATIEWLKEKSTDYYYQLKANLDPPKTLQELQDGVATPTLGYHLHHIVELASGQESGFSDDLLESRANVVKIPEIKHREITDWYQKPNQAYPDPNDHPGENWLSPRQYLEDKSWRERYDLGIKKLRDFGVLKP